MSRNVGKRMEENRVKKERIKVLLGEGLEARAIATRMGVSMSCIYAIRKEIEKEVNRSEQT